MPAQRESSQPLKRAKSRAKLCAGTLPIITDLIYPEN